MIKNKLNTPMSDGFYDMLSHWIDYETRATHGAPSLKTLRDEVIGIFVAAHGSTAVFLSWTFYHLAIHPDVQQKVFQEVTTLFSGRTPEYSDLMKMDYVRSVIEESMRMTPPGWIISRSTIHEDEIGGYKIPPRSMVLISPYLMHHHPEFWKQPEKFDPNRFYADHDGLMKQYARDFTYIPFSGGPRVCTGKNMAMMECLLIVTMVVQKFELQLKKNHQIKPIGGFTLGLGGGLLMELKTRTIARDLPKNNTPEGLRTAQCPWQQAAAL
jgi:cytochrome P450